MCDGIAIIRLGSHYVRTACKLKNTERMQSQQLPFAAQAMSTKNAGRSAISLRGHQRQVSALFGMEGL
ncbi:hypothetical protein MACH17_41760 [Phaeobacter inhibens]|nr:hypothetical protein MACH17_41760 [Phaeobacter inhibens]